MDVSKLALSVSADQPNPEGQTQKEPIKVGGNVADKAPSPEIPPVVTETKKDEIHPRFAALAKREKAIQRQTQEKKQLEATLAEREAKLKALESKYDLGDLTPAKALEFLQEKGMTYDDITSHILGEKDEDSQLKKLERNQQKLMEQIEADKKYREEQEIKQKEQELENNVKRFKATIYDHIDKNEDKYELIKIYGQQEEVYDLMDLMYRKDGKVLDKDEACSLVEKELEAMFEQGKKAKKFNQTQTEVKVDPKTEEPVLTTKAITNQMTASAPSLLPAKSERERIERAMKALSKGN